MKFFFQILSLVINKGKVSENKYILQNEKYKGIDNRDTPMRVYFSKKYTHKTVILFLGASPDGEKHKALNFLARSLTHFGYNVYIPRIPPLMMLDISNRNIDWIQHIFQMIQSREAINVKNITAVGISYGGGMLLKASLNDKMKNPPPKSIFLYGSGCDVDTILKFITKGEFHFKGKKNKIKPHDWGLTVFFHHFMDDIDFGFDKKNIKEVIQYRIKNEKDKANEKLALLKGVEYKITNSIINGAIIPEVQKIVDRIIIDKKNYINELSCKPICHKVESKVFIFHGANDNMVPFTESIQLDQLINNSNLLISYLFEHKGLSSKSNIFFKIKEAIKLLSFFYKFDKYNAS